MITFQGLIIEINIVIFPLPDSSYTEIIAVARLDSSPPQSIELLPRRTKPITEWRGHCGNYLESCRSFVPPPSPKAF